MTELEWLKQESGLTDDEWKAYEALGTTSKLLNAVKKSLGLSEQALKDKVEAENQRVSFEKRYNEEFVPEMRKVTTDALKATGEAARLKAELAQARQYGIVPDEPAPAAGDPPRAPGSPSPATPSFDADGFARRQSEAIITLQDLNAKHFKLFGSPLESTQELVDRVQRERTLGRKDYSLEKAWEEKFNVPAKREELALVAQRKHDDTIRLEERKKIAEAGGANPNLRSGVTSRFSSYKPSEANGGKEPWKASQSAHQRNTPWREKANAKIREAMAS